MASFPESCFCFVLFCFSISNTLACLGGNSIENVKSPPEEKIHGGKFLRQSHPLERWSNIHKENKSTKHSKHPNSKNTIGAPVPVTSCGLPNPLPLSAQDYECNAIGLGGQIFTHYCEHPCSNGYHAEDS